MATARTAANKTAAPSPSDTPQSHANPPGNALAAQTHGTALALPAAWAAKLAGQAKDAAASERPSVSKIGLRAGQITYGGQPVKGNILPCIILAAGFRNVYYDKPFDPNNLSNPACFALSIDGEGMEAHENVPDGNVPEDSDEKDRASPRDCVGCAFNDWGSDPKGGRGKACKETRRIIVLPADALDGPDECKKAEMAIIDIPVTSGKNYSNFVNGLAASANVPPWACLTNVSTQLDAKSQFKVTFTPIEVVGSVEVLEVLEARIAEAERLILTPYDEASSTTDGKMQDGKGVAAPAKKATKPKY